MKSALRRAGYPFIQTFTSSNGDRHENQESATLQRRTAEARLPRANVSADHFEVFLELNRDHSMEPPDYLFFRFFAYERKSGRGFAAEQHEECLCRITCPSSSANSGTFLGFAKVATAGKTQSYTASYKIRRPGAALLCRWSHRRRDLSQVIRSS